MDSKKQYPLLFYFIYWIETSIIDFLLIDIWWLPTEIITDPLSQKLTDFIHGRVISTIFGERQSAFLDFIKVHKVSTQYYIISSIISGLLEFDFSGVLNSTIGALINPAGIEFLYQLFVRLLRFFRRD